MKNFTSSLFKKNTYKELGSEMSSRIFMNDEESKKVEKD